MENNKKSWLSENKTNILMVAYIAAFVGWLGIMGHSLVHYGVKPKKTEDVKKSVEKVNQDKMIQYNDSIKSHVR